MTGYFKGSMRENDGSIIITKCENQVVNVIRPSGFVTWHLLEECIFMTGNHFVNWNNMTNQVRSFTVHITNR